MCPKVMDFVKISKIQLNRVVHDFKLNPSIIKKNKDLIQKWKIPTIERLVFNCGQLSKLQVFGGLDQDIMFYGWYNVLSR
jgi:hypothetical protein